MTTITVPNPLSSVTIRVRFGAGTRLRLRLACWMLGLVARIAGCNVDVSLDDDEVGVTAAGLPRALSVIPGRRGYRKDACREGAGLIVRLNGVEQRDVVAYDIDAGIVEAYFRGGDHRLRLARLGSEDVEGLIVNKHRGVVTVERKARVA